MKNLTISVHDEVYERMKKLKWVNWSALYRVFVYAHLEYFEQLEKDMKINS